jgi:hypothetical protein
MNPDDQALVEQAVALAGRGAATALSRPLRKAAMRSWPVIASTAIKPPTRAEPQEPPRA